MGVIAVCQIPDYHSVSREDNEEGNRRAQPDGSTLRAPDPQHGKGEGSVSEVAMSAEPCLIQSKCHKVLLPLSFSSKTIYSCKIGTALKLAHYTVSDENML